MNFYSHLNPILLIFLLYFLSNTSGNEWKKLKRKLFALGLLHSIRVKTIIPLAVPVPLPVIIKKVSNPIVLPPKRIPVLVPKPVPVYQFIPKFVPIYPKDKRYSQKSNHKQTHWSDGEDQWPQSQQIHEEYLTQNGLEIDPDGQQWTAHDGQQSDIYPLEAFADKNEYNFNEFHGRNQYLFPKKNKYKNKIFKNFRKVKKQNFRPIESISEYQDFEDNEDLLMLSTEPKPAHNASHSNHWPQHIRPLSMNNTNGGINEHYNRLKADGLPVHSAAVKQIINNIMPNVDNNKDHTQSTDTTEGKTSIKRIKVGEIRLKPHHLRALLVNKH